MEDIDEYKRNLKIYDDKLKENSIEKFDEKLLS